MDKKIKKVIFKCLILIKKGYSIDDCINKFKNYRNEINNYFRTIKNIKGLEVIMPEKDYRENSLAQIMSEAKRRDMISSEKADAAAAIKANTSGTKKRLLLRPAMIFLVFLVLSVFSFSGTLFASQETVPGQVLYPLKKSFEGFKLIVYPESQKDDLHFQFLNNRIDEADILLKSDDPDSDIFVENLIDEIDSEYQVCKQFNCFSTRDEDSALNSINNIKSRYRNRYKNNQDNDPDRGNSAGDHQEEDMGSNQQNTGNGGQQNKNEDGSHNKK